MEGVDGFVALTGSGEARFIGEDDKLGAVTGAEFVVFARPTCGLAVAGLTSRTVISIDKKN